MDLSQRLDILRQGDMLCDRNYETVLAVIDWFDHEQRIELTEHNASGFITHLCATLERVRKGEPLNVLSDELREAVQQEPNYEEALALVRQLSSVLPPLPESEEVYLVMHIGATLDIIRSGNS